MKVSWADVINILASSLESGLSLSQSIQALIQDGPPEFKKHIQSKPVALKAWVPLSTKIQIIFAGPELAAVRSVLLLSHKSGGQCVQQLKSCAHILREEDALREEIKSQTIQGKMSAWIVGLSPLFLLSGVSLLSPETVAPLFETAAGHIILLGVGLLVSVGLFLVHRVTDISI